MGAWLVRRFPRHCASFRPSLPPKKHASSTWLLAAGPMASFARDAGTGASIRIGETATVAVRWLSPSGFADGWHDSSCLPKRAETIAKKPRESPRGERWDGVRGRVYKAQRRPVYPVYGAFLGEIRGKDDQLYAVLSKRMHTCADLPCHTPLLSNPIY